MFTIVAVVVGILLVGVLVIATTKPATFRVQRAQTIQAPPGQIFELINDFHKWAEWSPYEKLDPTMSKTYTGAPSGRGAVYEWAGNSKAGVGRMEITDISSPSKVTIKLDFLKPFEGHNTAEFTLEARGGSTNVTWATFGPQAFAVKVMTVFISMDSLIGKDFAAGLANIKAIVEK